MNLFALQQIANENRFQPLPADLTRPLLIFDGDCSFCRRWITRWQHLTHDKIDYEPSQTAAARFPQIPPEEFGKSVFLVEPDGTNTRSAEAVFKSLALAGQYRSFNWLYQHAPPFALLTEILYGLVARHRDGIDLLDRAIVGTETRPATYVLTRGLFLRSIGMIYLIAFLSLFAQIDGLIGSNGILPASNFTTAVTQRFGATRWQIAPTLAYFNSSDAFLHGLCIAGIACAIALIVGIAPMFMTIALWAMYLSLVTVGQLFLGYQWDALLLEAGFLAILFSPILWAGSKQRPSRIVLFLIRWLLFRLMFLSALVKWFSGDETWRNMTALRFHFETQPIPTWTSWYAHNSPHWMLAFGCFAMFFIEGIVPFLYFAPRRARMFAFWLTVLLQLTIMATGNYGFFNLLTIVLAFSLLDDAAVARLFHRNHAATSPLDRAAPSDPPPDLRLDDCGHRLHRLRHGRNQSPRDEGNQLARPARLARRACLPFQLRQRLWPVRRNDQVPPRTPRRRQQQRRRLEGIPLQMESRRRQSRPLLLRAPHAAAGLATAGSPPYGPHNA